MGGGLPRGESDLDERASTWWRTRRDGEHEIDFESRARSVPDVTAGVSPSMS